MAMKDASAEAVITFQRELLDTYEKAGHALTTKLLLPICIRPSHRSLRRSLASRPPCWALKFHRGHKPMDTENGVKTA